MAERDNNIMDLLNLLGDTSTFSQFDFIFDHTFGIEKRVFPGLHLFFSKVNSVPSFT